MEMQSLIFRWLTDLQFDFDNHIITRVSVNLKFDNLEEFSYSRLAPKFHSNRKIQNFSSIFPRGVPEK